MCHLSQKQKNRFHCIFSLIIQLIARLWHLKFVANSFCTVSLAYCMLHMHSGCTIMSRAMTMHLKTRQKKRFKHCQEISIYIFPWNAFTLLCSCIYSFCFLRDCQLQGEKIGSALTATILASLLDYIPYVQCTLHAWRWA